MAKQQTACIQMFTKVMQQITKNDRKRNKMFRNLQLNRKFQAKIASASTDTALVMKNRRRLLEKRSGIVTGHAKRYCFNRCQRGLGNVRGIAGVEDYTSDRRALTLNNLEFQF